MTLVIAAAGPGRGSAAIAADYRYSDPVLSDEYDNPKIVAVPVTGSYLHAYLGTAGIALTPQLILSSVRTGSKLPERFPHERFCTWVVRAVVPFLRRTFAEAGLTHQGPGFPSCDEQLVIAHDDSCALIESNYGVLVPFCGYVAIGSAEAIASGALAVASRLELSPELMVRAAMEAAGSVSSTVHGSYQVTRGDGTSTVSSTYPSEVLDGLVLPGAPTSTT